MFAGVRNIDGLVWMKCAKYEVVDNFESNFALFKLDETSFAGSRCMREVSI
jgi:hypothetical protein